jgi:hypothetical protein
MALLKNIAALFLNVVGVLAVAAVYVYLLYVIIL